MSVEKRGIEHYSFSDLFRLKTLERWVIHIAFFMAGYLYGGAESEFNHMRMMDGAKE